ncbi:alpha/beta hydrolase [Arenibacter sp. N53]|uniref:alpha/beta hydrolase family protein n=1 Tax=Arenibacter TaxID=178469 RepID=UPI000CD45CDE|nr:MULTISPECIES: alpha/beta hydrolase [Arenibacter]MCM4151712.1 alpha/beta hydrolase [Arenibacter sp. N53]
MKHFIILPILFFTTTLIAQSFSGGIQYGKSSLNYKIRLVEMEGKTEAYFSSLAMNAYEIPCQKTTFKKDSLKFYVVSDHYTYEYNYLKTNNNLKGNLMVYSNENEQLLNTFETYLVPETKTERDVIKIQNLSFTSNGLELYGTLWEPKNSIHKGLFLVTSSQGNDRSGTNAEASFYADLGYTIFNYDKRGTGKSSGEWQSATIEELCSDDMNALEFFSKISTLSLSNIGIKGSSQGGIKIPFILSKMPELCFGISISCPDGTLLESDLNHWKNINFNNIGKDNIELALKVQKMGYNYLAGNISYELLMQESSKNSTEDWLKYVWIPERDVPKDYKLNFSGLPYFKIIKQPILVIQGLSDEVVPPESYKTIEKAIKKSKSPNSKVITLADTDHSMTYLNKEFPYFQILNPAYLNTVTDWLNKILKEEE